MKIVKNLFLKNVSKAFVQGGENVNVLNKLTYEFAVGTSYAITGESGAGKSTLLHLLAGTDQSTGGEVFFGDNDIAKFSAQVKERYWNQDVGLVFQKSNLIAGLSVIENIAIKGFIVGDKDALPRAHRLAEQVGLGHKKESSSDLLSQGEQQRVAIARALMNDPVFILADEPTASLDEKTGAQIIDLLILLQKQNKVGLILSTHNLAVAARMDVRLILGKGNLSLLN